MGASGELFDASPNGMSDIFAQFSCLDPLFPALSYNFPYVIPKVVRCRY